MGETLEKGLAHPGPAYNTMRWRELVFVITLLQAWKKLTPPEQRRLINHPWRFGRARSIWHNRGTRSIGIC